MMTELHLYEGEQWPRDEAEAAGPIPEELWEVSLNGSEESPNL